MKTILVGNGPSAIKKEYGTFIDELPIVVRFNNFIISPYEKYIGHKTDIWAVNIGYLFRPDIVWNHTTPQPKTVIFAPYSITEYENYKDCQKCNLTTNEVLCDIQISKWTDMYYNKKEKKWISTGLMAIMQFKPCFVIGFDSFSESQHHYGDSYNFKTHHDSLVEKSIINDLVKNKEICLL